MTKLISSTILGIFLITAIFFTAYNSNRDIPQELTTDLVVLEKPILENSNQERINRVIQKTEKPNLSDIDIFDIVMIDDIDDPTLWDAKSAIIGEEKAIEIIQKKHKGETFRKFDGFIDLKNYISLKITVDDLNDLEWLSFYLLEDREYNDYFEYDLLHSLSSNDEQIILNKSNFSIGKGNPKWNNISTIKIGYGTKNKKRVSVIFGEIITFDALPMCTIWFDDGWETTYTKAYEIMEPKDIQGVLSVISSHVGYDGYCMKNQLDVMYDSGWDFTNHTHGHSNLTELNDDDVKSELTQCEVYLNSNGYTRASNNIVAPYLAVNDSVNNVIEASYLTSRPRPDRFNYLPIIDPYNLCFKEVTADIDPSIVQEWIDKAIKDNLWLVLLFHSIEYPNGDPTKYSEDNFKNIIDYLDEKHNEIQMVILSELSDSNAFSLEVFNETQVNTMNQNKVFDEISNNEHDNFSDYEDWELVFIEDFNGGKIRDKYWNIIEAEPFKNNELQTYRAENVVIEDGYLKLISTMENNDYFSGAVSTNNKIMFLHGKIEIRAKFPKGTGMFPALWMLPQNGYNLPEIDIIEFVGNEPDEIWHVLHYIKDDVKSRKYTTIKGEENYNEDFHIFSLEWSEDSLRWLIDGEETFIVTEGIPTTKMYLYINTAIGGYWPGAPDKTTSFPQETLIDYIKYYEKSGGK